MGPINLRNKNCCSKKVYSRLKCDPTQQYNTTVAFIMHAQSVTMIKSSLSQTPFTACPIHSNSENRSQVSKVKKK